MHAAKHTAVRRFTLPRDPHTSVQNQCAQRKRWSAIGGWLLSLLLLAGIGWVVPLREVWQALLQASPLLLTLAMVPVIVNLCLRGARWALLFRPRFQISAKAALGPALVGLGLNAVLPGRVGEIARVVLAARRFRTSIPFTTATVVAERLLDALTLLAFLGGSLAFLPPADTEVTGGFLGYSLSPKALSDLAKQIGLVSTLLIGSSLSLLIPKFRHLLSHVLGALPVVGSRLGSWAEHVLEELGLGLAVLRRPWILIQTLLLSVLMWLALALAYLLVSKAMPGIDLSFRHALVVTSVCVAASALPSAPGAWGFFEAGSLMALALMQITPEPGAGIAFALASHLCSYLPVVCFGAVAGLRLGAFHKNFKQLEQEDSEGVPDKS